MLYAIKINLKGYIMKTKKLVPIIGERVKAALAEDGRTQKEMAAEIDVTQEHLNRCLRSGEISKPYLLAIAEYLDVSPEWLSDDKTNNYRFAYRRWRALNDKHNIFKSLFTLLGYNNDQFVLFEESDIEKLMTDINGLIAFYQSKIIERNEGNGDFTSITYDLMTKALESALTMKGDKS